MTGIGGMSGCKHYPHVVFGSTPSNGEYVIYGLCDTSDPDHVRYIGFSKDANFRLRRHLQDTRPSPKLRWIQRVLSTGGSIQWRLLRYAACRSEAAFCERAYIRGYRLSGHKLTNVSAGGDAGERRISVTKFRWKPYGAQTQQSRAKLSASLRAWWARRLADPQQRAEISARFSAAKKGIKPTLTEQQRAAMRQRASLRRRTPEQKARQSEYKRAWWAAKKQRDV